MLCIERLHAEAIRFYSSLFLLDDPSCRGFPLRDLFSSVTVSSLDAFSMNVSLEELKNVVFSMGPFKAPSLDGFHALFYQSEWDTIGMDVYT